MADCAKIATPSPILHALQLWDLSTLPSRGGVSVLLLTLSRSVTASSRYNKAEVTSRDFRAQVMTDNAASASSTGMLAFGNLG